MRPWGIGVLFAVTVLALAQSNAPLTAMWYISGRVMSDDGPWRLVKLPLKMVAAGQLPGMRYGSIPATYYHQLPNR